MWRAQHCLLSLWSVTLSISYGLVEQGGDILFLVPLSCTEHHHTILRGWK